MRTVGLFLAGAAVGALICFIALRLDNSTETETETPKTDAAPRYAFHQEEYIHPRIVLNMMGDLSSGEEMIVTVDIGAANREYSHMGGHEITELMGNTWVQWNGAPGEYAMYRYIGASPSGVQMIVSILSFGGSGSFGDVLLFRIDTDQTFFNKRERTLLTLLDAIPLGDRYEGAIEYKDGVLNIGADEGRFKGGGGPRDGKPLSIPVP